MKYVLLVTMLLSSITFGAIDKNEACATKKDKRMEFDVHASNIANWNTTRTPEGGPYKPKNLVCKNHICDIIETAAFTEEYEPDHPDADMAGFVKYPKMNLDNELRAMSEIAKTFKESEKVCP